MLASLPSVDLPYGDGIQTHIRRVRVGDSHVLVARLASGEVVAFGPSCPHQFTELDEATIWDGNLRCPRHSYLFDTRTGENIHPRRDAPKENLWKLRPGYLTCYQVREEDGCIWVSDEAKPPPPSYDPALEVRPVASAVDPEPAPMAVAPAGPVEQSVKFLTATSGTAFDIRLPFVPRPGFDWTFDVVGHILEVVGEEFESGYSPCQVIQVAAEGTGAATVTCTYASAGGEPAEVRTFIVRVQPT